jgi:hypothetical protein
MTKLKCEVTKNWTFKNWEFYLKFGFRICEISVLEKLTSLYLSTKKFGTVYKLSREIERMMSSLIKKISDK